MLNFKQAKTTEGHEQDSTPDQQDSTVDVPDPGAKKKPRSEKQRAASRDNGSHGRAPNDTTRTRYNATRHGLRGQGLTPWDDAEEYREILGALEDKYNSSDPFDAISISESALEIIRIRRINKLEADNIIAMSSFS